MIVEKVVVSLLDYEIGRCVVRRHLTLDGRSILRGVLGLLRLLLYEDAVLAEQVLVLLRIHTLTLRPEAIPCFLQLFLFSKLECFLTAVSFLDSRGFLTYTVLVRYRINSWQIV